MNVIMMIHEITEQVGRYRPRKRIGRGRASGHGKTSGRGQKGARSRSGWAQKKGYEGGQNPLIRRIPKRGFSNAAFKVVFHIVNVKSLDAHCKSGEAVSAESLVKLGLIRDTSLPLKVLGEGELSKKLNVTAAKFSASAKAKIEAAGGTVTEVNKTKWIRPAPPKKAPAKAAS
jgi:large subunit ribosomal protein L15